MPARKSEIEIGNTVKNPKFLDQEGRLGAFNPVVDNPMWRQSWFTEADYDADEFDRFSSGGGLSQIS